MSGSPALGPRHADPARPRLSAARRAVWHALLAAGDDVTVATLSQRLGQHPNTVREHLDALVAADRVERSRSLPAGRGRPAWLYRAVGPAAADVGPGRHDPGDIADLQPADFEESGNEYASLALALIEEVGRSDPHPRAVARQAGERWGRSLASHRGGPPVATRGAPQTPTRPSDAVLDMLTGLRFEPRPSPRPGVVRLTTCPLLDAARRNPDLVCQVHLGIVRGALERVGGDPDGVALEPFAEPGACLLTLPDRR